MAYFGYTRGRRKASATLRFTHNGDGTATQFVDGTSTAGVSIGSGTWFQLVASLATAVNMVEIFDSTGNTFRLGTGASSSETILFLVTPGGNGALPVNIAAGTRVALQLITQAPAGTETIINFYD